MTLLVISGFEPTAQAGMLKDTKVCQELGVAAHYALTATCAASDKSVENIAPCTTFAAQLPHEATIVKIGMVGNLAQAEYIAQWLNTRKHKPFVIFDTVHCASSGEVLTDIEAIKYLLPHTDLATLNLQECYQLTGIQVHDKQSAASAAALLNTPNCIIKGGHSSGDRCIDYIFLNNHLHILSASRISGEFRGTGCTLSTAISAYLAQGEMLANAIFKARLYLQKTLAPETSFADFIVQTREAFIAEAPKTYPIISSCQQLQSCIDRGFEYAQLRLKDVDEDQLELIIKQACHLAHEHKLKLFINDYAAYAIKHGAYGVHLGQQDLLHTNIDALRQTNIKLGISTHNYLEIITALNLSPSYIAIGAIFETPTKDMTGQIQGIELLQDYCSTLNKRIPIIAIGGIEKSNAAQVMATGVDGIAFVRAAQKTKREDFEQL